MSKPPPEVIINPPAGDLKRRAAFIEWVQRNAAEARAAKARAARASASKAETTQKPA